MESQWTRVGGQPQPQFQNVSIQPSAQPQFQPPAQIQFQPPAQNFPQQVDTKKALAEVLARIGIAATQPPAFVPVTSAVYIQRLEKALLKNFDFIRRKDLGQLKPPPRKPEAPSSGGGQGYGRENTSFIARPGIGNQQAGSASVKIQAQVQTQIVESLSIYISGLPKDIEEQDLEILFSSQGTIKKIKIYASPDGTKKGDALVTYTRAEAAAMACIQVSLSLSLTLSLFLFLSLLYHTHCHSLTLSLL
jgi:hypothetical protein